MVLGDLLARGRHLRLDHLTLALRSSSDKELVGGDSGAATTDPVVYIFFFGLLWGFVSLPYGLTMLYLALSLGTGVALGFCAAFGTLVPPIFKLLAPNVPVEESIVQIASSHAGQITLAGVGVCLLGIAVAALAGLK